MSAIFKETLAALRPDDVRFILANQPRMDGDEDDSPPPVQDQTVAMAGMGDDQDEDGRRRRHIERDWPDLATKLTAEYYGQTYTAQIIPAKKKLKSNKQIVLLDGPAQGEICDSFSEAMITATEKQRAEQNLARKGVSNGWVFWQWPGKPAEYNDVRTEGDE